jgi:hypothetical protein
MTCCPVEPFIGSPNVITNDDPPQPQPAVGQLLVRDCPAQVSDRASALDRISTRDREKSASAIKSAATIQTSKPNLAPFMIHELFPSLTETASGSHPCCVVSVTYDRTLHFHGGNTGSNPVRDAKSINTLHEIWRAFPWDGTYSEQRIADSRDLSNPM